MNSRPRTRLAALCGVTALATLTTLATATAATPVLNGGWAPYDRCPVDAAAMLAADGLDQTPQCVVASSTGGSIKLGRTVVPVGKVNVQFGAIQHSDGTTSVVAPTSGAITGDTATVPGGLLGLMCPSSIPVIGPICKALIEDNSLNKITATVVSAGAPRDFNQYAAIVPGEPIVTVPIKIKLKNPFLSDNCYIGSNSNPILLKPRNAVEPAFAGEIFNGNGTPAPEGEAGDLTRLSFSGSPLTDSTFSVPGANGCGLLGAIDLAVNLKTGIPAGSGTNSITLTNAQLGVMAPYDATSTAPNAGQAFSGYWHSAAN
ncbi:hypothetical protein ACFQLX_05870 [Streptomyces polyrhachis]|uniref:Secreted protein n=1 Tax=Streptomyces polyrhachis TaxID=1282885 RepID=A0ABW2GE88_9ACTN